MKNKKTDSEIQHAVTEELTWDTRLVDIDVVAEVTDGVVTLRGSVDSWAKRLAAQEAAHRVAGVLDVANELQVTPVHVRQPSDTEIAVAIRSALEWDAFVPSERIRSSVSEGWVTLEGDVENYAEREEAERSLKNLAGVRGITNSIVVVGSADSEDVRVAIEEALARRAERDARRIDLEVRDGRVTLSGFVHSLSERAAVLGAARGTRGVRSVEDRLLVQP
jgi:osmotically-inducible protein OsmY